MFKLTQEMADKLKVQGYTQIASLIKQVMTSRYYNINFIDDIINNGGKWTPANKGYFPSLRGNRTWHGRIGTYSKDIDWKITIEASEVRALMREEK